MKQSHVRLDGIVTNEQLCLQTAKNLGIDVPDSFVQTADLFLGEYKGGPVEQIAIETY